MSTATAYRRMKSKEDELSSLPDDILANILSRLQINSAIATSVLSHRWRYLWTGVTSVKFDNDGHYVSERTSDLFSNAVVDIVRQLTSPTLCVFKLQLSSLSYLCDPGVADACFREVCGRNVEQIIIEEDQAYSKDCFPAPASLFSSKNLVVLKLQGRIKFNLPENTDIQLPNLRKIRLNYIVGVPHEFLGNLFRSSQSLMDADLIFIKDDNISEPEPQIVLNLSAPNLRLLRIDLLAYWHSQQPKILIYAPKLETLNLVSFASDYYYIQNPSKLVKASIDMKWNLRHLDVPLGREMFKFIPQLSSVRELSLRIMNDELTDHDPYHCLNSANLGTFPNLERLETSLCCGGWKELLLSMTCFPNLRHVEVCLSIMKYSNPVMDPINWCVPECLSKLKTIVITTRLRFIDDDLKLLGYILSNALVLEKIQIRRENSYGYNAFKFCKSLFQLPRASSTCEIVFRIAGLVLSSNDDWKNGEFIRDFSSLIDYM